MIAKVSVIVPVYNSEKYIGKCIESITLQSYRALQIILVNDGSTDKSLEICKSYAERDKRIIIVNQENKGLSEARNAGLREVVGQYVCFVDADDYVAERYVEQLVSPLLGGGGEFSFCDIESNRIGNFASSYFKNVDKDRYMDRYFFAECLNNMIAREYVLAVLVCNKMYRTAFLKDCDLKFRAGRWHEDEFFVNSLLKYMTGAFYVPNKLYMYIEHPESITGVNHKKDLRHLDVIDAYEERAFLEKNLEWYELARITVRNGFLKIIELQDAFGEDLKREQKALRECLVAFWKRNYQLLSVKQRLKYGCYLYMPHLYQMFWK